MALNIVPRENGSQNLGTAVKQFGTVYAENFGGGLAEKMDAKASVSELERVEALIHSTSPSYFEKDGFTRGRGVHRNGTAATIYWKDAPSPNWVKTTIVKKAGDYPAYLADGTVVVENTTRDAYLENGYTDADADGYKYRAFITWADGTTTTSKYDRFEFFLYAVYIDRNDGIESTCVHNVVGFENEDYEPIAMQFGNTADDGHLDWGDWRHTPFMPRPCMLRSNGSVDYYLDENDYTKKEDGTASDVTNMSYDGNAMVEWSPIYRKVVDQPNRIYIYFCSVKLDDDYECYSALKEDGTYGEHFYTPIYEGSLVGSKLRSMSTGNKPTASTTMANEMAYAEANGTGWEISVWSDEDLIRCLGVLVLKRLNIAKAIGYNCGSSTAALTHNCGSGNTKGMFFGHYTTSAYAIKFFGMENWYGHRWRRTAGFISPNDGYGISVKLTRSKADGSTVNGYNTDGTGYIATGLTVPAMSEAYLVDMHADKRCTMVPKATTKYVGDNTSVSGSSTTYYCDGGWSANTLTALFVGGSVAHGSICGLFCFAVNNAPSVANWYYGASLSYRGF